MATAKKLPSGSWRCRVFSHKEKVLQPDGTYKDVAKYVSFTVDDPSPKGKRKCESLAAAWAANKENSSKPSAYTFGQALDEYIALRSSVLSPGTIREYKRSRRCDLQGLMDIRIESITQNDIQREINKEALDHSPKSVKNMHGLITAVMDVYRPDFKIRTELPKRVRTKMEMPTSEDIKMLLDAVRGTDIEIPVLLAVFGPMRRGEICALDSDHIHGTVVHVEYSMAKDEHGQWVKKRPKSYAGDRFISFPQFVIDKLSGIDGPITDLHPDNITHRFGAILRKNNLGSYRFHDLRHYSASFLHAMGMADQYIMERAGWGSDAVLKSVYRHSLNDVSRAENDRANSAFSSLYSM